MRPDMAEIRERSDPAEVMIDRLQELLTSATTTSRRTSWAALRYSPAVLYLLCATRRVVCGMPIARTSMTRQGGCASRLLSCLHVKLASIHVKEENFNVFLGFLHLLILASIHVIGQTFNFFLGFLHLSIPQGNKKSESSQDCQA